MTTPTQELSTPSNSSGLPHVNDNLEVVGTLKSFNDATGYGFIASSQVSQDIFLQGSQLPTGLRPETGRRLRCTLWHNKQGRPQARNVVWLAPLEVAQAVEPHASATHHVGTLKSMGATYGFIECAETFRLYGNDVFIKRPQLLEGWQLQQPITFEVMMNAQGRPQAKNVQQHVEPEDRSINTTAAPLERDSSINISGDGSYTCSTSTEGTISPLDPMRSYERPVATRW